MNYNIQNLLKLQNIFSKTVLVFNNKLKELREASTQFIPCTDGLGPVADFNLLRWSRERLTSEFKIHANHCINLPQVLNYIEELDKVYDYKSEKAFK